MLSRADRLLQKTLAVNEDIEAIKGIGRVKLTQNDRTSTFRAAWIGKRPDRFRLEVMSVTGQPMISFASDGKHVYLLSYSDNHLYRKKTSESGLKRIISIDMTPADILDLLSGRPPVHQGGSVRLDSDGETGEVLVLEGKTRDDIERIFLDNDGGGIRKFERLDRKGKLLFQAVFESKRESGEFQMPDALTVTNDDGAMIQITVQRCWVNPELTDDQFVLKAS